MSPEVGDVFADTAFWVALVIKQDQHHDVSQKWALRIDGRIITSWPVLLETANSLARPTSRAAAIALIEHLSNRSDVEIVPLSPELWNRGWAIYARRQDKGWSLTDCISFIVMEDLGLANVLTTDDHFRQAGFRALLLERPD